MGAALFAQGYDNDQATLATANTDDTFGSGTIVTLATGVAGGKPIRSVVVSIPGTISVATRISFAVDNGSIKVPYGSIIISPFTVALGQPPRVFPVNLPVPVWLKDSTEILKAIIYTNDTVKLRAQAIKYQ